MKFEPSIEFSEFLINANKTELKKYLTKDFAELYK